jgi:hypothetical protein
VGLCALVAAAMADVSEARAAFDQVWSPFVLELQPSFSRWSECVVAGRGQLDRPRLGAFVASIEDCLQSRAQLERIHGPPSIGDLLRIIAP